MGRESQKAWSPTLLAFARQREDLLEVAMLRQALEQQGPDLALELPHRPALARSFDLVERARLVVSDAK